MKEKFEIEFPINCTPKVLYGLLSTPAGLSEWFADDVHLAEGKYKFVWDGSEEIAEIIGKKENQYIRYKWEDDEDSDAYFEFKITRDELTSDVALLITDYAEPDDKEDAVELWESQLSELKHGLGL